MSAKSPKVLLDHHVKPVNNQHGNQMKMECALIYKKKVLKKLKKKTLHDWP